MKHPLAHLPNFDDLVTFDLQPGTKKPAVGAWQKLPPGHRGEDKSYGLVCGPGWFVLDVDDPAALEALEKEYGDLPETLTVHSAPQSGGFHMYYLGDAATGTDVVGPGLDIRGEGKGYVLGPGSDYPGNPGKGIPAGGEYVIDDLCPQTMTQAPDWLIALCHAPKETPTRDAIGLSKTLDDLRQVSKGKGSPFAVFWREVCTGLYPDSLPAGGWNDYLSRATMWLAGQEDWSEVLGQTVVELMGPSLSLMHKHRRENGQDLEHLTEQAIASLYDRGAQKLRVEQQAKRLTAEAIEKAKADTSSAPRILQFRHTFYIAHETKGFYGPLVEKELWGAVRDLPLPAPRTMEIMKPTQKGFVSIPPRELFEIYGRGGYLQDVRQSLSIRVAYLADGVLHMPSTFPPKISPVYHEEIDTWLDMIGGDTVRDWIAVSMELEEAAPALWFTGLPGVGKSLIVRGLAALWGHKAATTMANAFGQFNEALTRCPIVEGQESIPSDFRGNPRLEELKTLISDTSRTVEPKGLPRLAVDGAVRVVMSSNNMDMIRGGRDITTEDAEALVARIIHIRVDDPAPRAYLDARAVQRDWIDSGALAEHFTWLIENRDPPRGLRFRLSPLANGLDSSLRTGPGGGFFVLRAVYEWILRTAQAVAEGAPLERTKKFAWVEGALRVSATGIKAKLDHDRKSMNDRTLGAALRRVSTHRVTTRLPDGSTPKLWAINTEYVAHWAESEGWGSEEELRAAIKVLDAAEVPG